jgi:hypothetical protein
MQRFEDAGYSLAELRRLNKVRIHQQVIFLSDVLRANGLRLDGKYLQRRPSSATWSKHKFPKEKPCSRDFALWRAALAEIAPSHRSSEKLGRFVSPRTNGGSGGLIRIQDSCSISKEIKWMCIRPLMSQAVGIASLDLWKIGKPH